MTDWELGSLPLSGIAGTGSYSTPIAQGQIMTQDSKCYLCMRVCVCVHACICVPEDNFGVVPQALSIF